MVEKKGVEPSTSAMRMLRSSQLSYFPAVTSIAGSGDNSQEYGN